MDGSASAVDDGVELLGGGGVGDHLPRQHIGCGVEQPPGGAPVLELVEAGAFPFVDHLGDALHGDDAGAVHLQDGVVSHRVREFGGVIALEGSLLAGPLVGKRLDHVLHQAGQVALGVRRVFAPDDVIGEEGQIVAAEHSAAEANADGEGFVVAVAQGDGVFVAAVGAFQRQHAKVAHAVLAHPVVLVHHLMTVVGQRMAQHVHQAEVRDGNVGRRRQRRVELAQLVERDLLRSAMKHQSHRFLSKEQGGSASG